MQVIPALDLLDGNAVRLRKGRYEDVTIYASDPAALARTFSGRVPWLHVVDLEGARAGRAVQRPLVRAVIEAFAGNVQVGGGVRSLEALESYIELGAKRVILGTVAITEPELVAQACQRYPGQIVVSLDAEAGLVKTQGWVTSAEVRVLDVAHKLAAFSPAAFLYTDIERDGTEVGPNLAETRALAEQVGVPVIASGGVGTLEHLRALARLGPRISGAIVGRALLEGRFSLEDAVSAANSESPARAP